MPRASNFNDYPPFPEDVVVADLPQLSLCKLLENNIVESEKLFRSCRESGFFLLNLTGSSVGKDMLRNAELGFELSQKLFGLEQEELGRYTLNVEESLYGYALLIPFWSNFVCINLFIQNGRIQTKAYWTPQLQICRSLEAGRRKPRWRRLLRPLTGWYAWHLDSTPQSGNHSSQS